MGIPYEAQIGDIVYSKAGRDACRYYVVMWCKDEYIGICDGDLHKTDKVKKKKIKHVKFMEHNASYIKNKIETGEKVTNSEVRRSISEFVQSRPADEQD